MSTNEKRLSKYLAVFWISLLLLLCNAPLLGQHFTLSNGLRFELLAADDGLPSNSANAFIHDRQGYIWIGTFNGLVRYDGYEFKVYPKEENGLNGDYVMALHEDSQGYIWIGTMFHGLQRLNPRTEVFTSYPIGGKRGISWRYVTQIQEDANGTIWVGTTGGLNAIRSEDGSFDPAGIEVQHYFPFGYPDTLLQELSQRVSSDQVLAKISQVGNSESRTQRFELEKSSTLLIASMGEYGGRQKMADYGWITNDKEEVVWSMDYQKTYVAKSVEPKEDHSNNRQIVELKKLPTGKYTLHYKSNQQHAYKKWSLPKIPIPYNNDEAIAPAFEELWGIAIIDCDESAETKYQEWLNEVANTSCISGSIITSISLVGKNEIWIGTSGGLDQIKWQEEEYVFNALNSTPSKGEACTIDFINHIYTNNEEEIKIYGGRLNENKHQFDLIIQQCNPSQLDFQTIFHEERSVNHGELFEDAFGKLWLTSYIQGLYRLDEESEAAYGFALTEFPLDTRYTWKAFKDRTGAVWLGVWKAGIYKLNPTVSQFNFKSLPVRESTFVTDFAKADNGALYVSTDKEGVFRWDPLTNKIESFTAFSDGKILPSEAIQCLSTDAEGNIWIGMYNKGLVRYEPKTQRIKYYVTDGKDDKSLVHDDVHTLLLDRDGELWVGTQDGLSRYDVEHDNFSNFINPHVDVSYDDIIDIYEDKSGVFWLVNGVRGLFSFDKKALAEGRRMEEAFQEVQESDQIWKVFNDQSGNSWITSRDGLTQTNPGFTGVQKQCVSDLDINFIQEDKSGVLWLSGDMGIVKYDPELETQSFFGSESGVYLKGEQYGSGATLDDGRLVVGGLNGFYCFDPTKMISNKTVPQIVIKNISFPESIIADDSTLLTIDLSSGLKLEYGQNTMAIEYAGLHYDVGQPKRYAYRLRGLSEDWIPVGAERTVRLTGLPPGQYTFEVKIANSDLKEQIVKAAIPIRISPPWWRTHVALGVFALLAFILLYLLYRAQLRQALVKAEAKRATELSELKADFFSNVTHEFRTPLTLIIEPVRQLIKQVEDPLQKSHLQMVENNSNKLLQMVNSLLDLAKIDGNQMELNLQKGDVHDLINNMLPAFDLLAKKKNIQLVFKETNQSTSFYFDTEKVESVLYNLLSNAIKYTPENGMVHLMLETDRTIPLDERAFLKISVQDTGPGIPAESISKVFDRFFQNKRSGEHSQSGTGIGLALCKELVTLMDGQLKVNSKIGEGTTFDFWLPVIKNWEGFELKGQKEELSVAVPLALVTATDNAEEEQVTAQERTTILIVEDNEELRTFVKNYLKEDYKILEAENGQTGVDLAVAEIPDLIISDLMMPIKDGLQLCTELKAHELTAHIPIVLLTAKSALKSKLSGLNKGADVYLTKPFQLEELEGYVSQLIENRKLLQQKYSIPSIDGIKETITEVVVEDEFLLKLNEIIFTNIEDPLLNVESLVTRTFLSRSQLYRKVKALTDQSPNEYLRNYRLDHGMKLLKRKEGNVFEVATMVGFNNEKYFSTRFKKRFGVSPSDILT